MQTSRRQFLKFSAASLCGLSAMKLGALPSDATPVAGGGKAKSVIYIYLSGGFSHLDSFDIKPENKNVTGKTEAIRTSADGIRLSQYFPNLAQQMHHACLINSMNTTQGAHRQGNYFMHTSYPMRGTIKHPHLGAWASKMKGPANPSLPAYVKIGSRSGTLGGGFFESKHAALPIGNPAAGLQHSVKPGSVSDEIFEQRLAMLNSMNSQFDSNHSQKIVRSYSQSYKDAVRLMKSEDLKVFSINEESEKLQQAYGDNDFGKGVLMARRLVEKGVRFVEVGLGGWDNHNNIYDSFPEKAAILDNALGTLLQDLNSRGLLDSTMVVVATEFGRTPTINQRGGRDHYPKAFSTLLAGGGIQGGQIYGKTDAGGMEISDNAVSVPNFNATIAHAMGLPWEKTLYSPEGRPFKVAHKGKPLTSLF